MELIISIIAAVIAVGAAVAAFLSAYYAKVSIKQQREQWINQEFIKREADVLIEFRQMLVDSVESINWVHDTLLLDQPFVHFMLGITPEDRLQITTKHFYKLNRLKELYNSHQLIFRKHRLNEKMPHIFAVLDVMEQMAALLELVIINKVFDIETRRKIIMAMNVELFKEIMQKLIVESQSISAEKLRKLDTDMEIAHTLQCLHIGLSMAFMYSFGIGTLAKLWKKGNTEKVKEYGETAKTYVKTHLNTNRYDFYKHLSESWDKFQKGLMRFLFSMDEKTTFEGKIPNDIRELEKLSYPRAEKMFVIKDDQTQ